VPEEERDAFWKAMKTDLPNSFRFTGSKSHALAVQETLRTRYIPEITSIKFEGQYAEAPQPVEWYPDRLAWFMTTPKNVIRRFAPFASFQKFLVAETDVGNITRQEVVSMIPPLVMDIKPGMTVLDLCAAPGSKSAQLIELLNAGEEDRSRHVAHNFANNLDKPEGEEYADDGRSTGLLIANDIDYKRAHMLVHQMKRLSSPNIIVTNHDATIYPSIKLPSLPSTDGRPSQNRYLKFDRILADVPCSGDGTLRKNLEIWKLWNPSNGLGLHQTQVRILMRSLQMLKVGGKVVYSTCSMNPVEDEAVLAEAIRQCGGTDVVQLVDTKDMLPGLKRSPGLKQWKIMDRSGRIWNDWASVEKQKAERGDEGLNKLQQSMFATDEDIPLERAMRVYPHSQNTGAFFISILEKKSELRSKNQSQSQVRSETDSKPATSNPAPEKQIQEGQSKVETIDSNGVNNVLETKANGEVEKVHTPADATTDSTSQMEDTSAKRKREDEDQKLAQPEQKRVKSEVNERKARGQPFEEPFKYLDANVPELQSVKKFYGLSPQFPMDRFMVRNADGIASKNIYYTTALTKDILQENEGKGMKFVHSGVKMLVKQDAPSPETCPWRIQTDGLRIMETWVGQNRKVKLRKKATLRKLLVEMFPNFHEDNWKSLDELGPQMRNIPMGCCVLVVEPSEEEGGFPERMIFPLWKSIHSLNLMMPKEDRKAMLLRLFNDDTPLLNFIQNRKQQGNVKKDEKEQMPEETTKIKDDDQEDGINIKTRNTSSPEPIPDTDDQDMIKDEEEGGVSLTAV